MTTRETKEDDWCTPVNLGSQVNSPNEDNTPCISSDGLELYFTSNRNDWKTWVTKRATKDEPWGTPVSLGSTIHSGGAVMHPGISADGLTLLFCSWRSGGCGKADIWVTRRATTDSPWTEPVNLGPTVNSSRLDFVPCLSSDGSILYFTSDRPGGLGSWDLWQVSVLPMHSDMEKDSDSDSAVKSNKGRN
jgi:Tol biopolymer transport system component